MTVNRAPQTRPVASRRLSAVMVPLWASMIWREMLKPSPEWVPNFSSAGRSL
jgi:hypothetical protein